MASIPLPVATAADQITMRVERALEPIMQACQTAAASTDRVDGKNAATKANLTLMNTALGQWTAALTTQIAAL
jgi:lactate dehydrogenase-like 2-hydroxyacid dehydrogenase